MPYESESTRFLDWVREEIISYSGLSSNEVFDEREKDLSWVLGKEIESKLGVAVLVSLPRLSRINKDAPNDKSHSASVLVTFSSNELLADGGLFAYAESAYIALDGAEFNMASGCKASTTCDNFMASTSGQSTLITFDVSTNLDFNE